MKKSRIHAIAGILALTLIATFFTSTVIVEIIGDETAISFTKSAILVALLVLVPSMAITGATGRLLAGKRGGPVIKRKKVRMAAIAAIGLLVLVPCAVTLRQLAVNGQFDSTFYLVQAIELIAGAANVTLMAMNVRDGRLLVGKIRRKPKRPAVAARTGQPTG
jgi:hypothetical protein